MYLDSAIIVKLLNDEPDSDFIEDAISDAPLSSSELAWTEVFSALCGRERAKLLKPRERVASWNLFMEKVSAQEIQLHPLDSTTLKKANHVLERCHPHVPLRTLDAIHIAACDLSQDFPLCTTDARMRAAAERLGIPVFPETSAN
jgi:predicted nucleic acid-binding protein